MTRPVHSVELRCVCGNACELSLEGSAEPADVTCAACGRTVYWHVCAVCGTGWSDSEHDSGCPECKPDRSPPVWAKLGFMRKPCPHCGKDLTPFLLLPGNSHGIVSCPHCRRL